MKRKDLKKLEYMLEIERLIRKYEQNFGHLLYDLVILYYFFIFVFFISLLLPMSRWIFFWILTAIVLVIYILLTEKSRYNKKIKRLEEELKKLEEK